MALNAYFFAVAASCAGLVPVKDRHGGVSKSLQSWDSCTTKIIFGASPEEAQRTAEAEFDKLAAAEPESETTVHKTTITPFVDILITESGNLPLDWPNILKKMETSMEGAQVDDFEQGYWVDVDSIVRPDKLSFSAGTLQSDVPEDIRSGLNWSSDRQFFFLFAILRPLPVPPDPLDQPEVANPELIERVAGEDEEPAPMSEEELYRTFPAAFDKEAVVLAQARNSVVAAWLWRRYAASTPHAATSIRIEPWPGIVDQPDAA